MSPSTGLSGAGNSPALIPVFTEESLGRFAAMLQWRWDPRERGLRGDAPLPPELRDALLEAALSGIDRDKLADRALQPDFVLQLRRHAEASPSASDIR